MSLLLSTIVMESLPITNFLYDVKIAIPILLLTGYLAHWYLSYRRLSHIPGPWLAGWSNLWLVGALYRQRSNLEFYELAQKYGMHYPYNDIASLGFN